eukprot:351961-Chlamydomonas_euryale.AAC.1
MLLLLRGVGVAAVACCGHCFVACVHASHVTQYVVPCAPAARPTDLAPRFVHDPYLELRPQVRQQPVVRRVARTRSNAASQGDLSRKNCQRAACGAHGPCEPTRSLGGGSCAKALTAGGALHAARAARTRMHMEQGGDPACLRHRCSRLCAADMLGRGGGGEAGLPALRAPGSSRERPAYRARQAKEGKKQGRRL